MPGKASQRPVCHPGIVGSRLGLLAWLLASWTSLAIANEPPATIVAGSFSNDSSANAFSHWQPYHFGLLSNHTRYRLIDDRSVRVMEASSQQGAGGLIRRLNIDLSTHPLLQWRWKITTLPTRANDLSRDDDDYSARLYVIFDAPRHSSPVVGWLKNLTGLSNTHAINYIWANQAAPGTHMPSPYTRQSMMLAVNSGSQALGEWVSG